MEKKLPETLAPILKSEEVKATRPPDIPGRSAIRPHGPDPALLDAKPERPIVNNGYEREFVYVYGAVSPLEGQFDWMICPKMNTERWATSRKSRPRTPPRLHRHGGQRRQFACSQGVVVPENVRLLRLPAYAPELNPQEHVWDELREKLFPNRVFADLDSVRSQLEYGLPHSPQTRNACEV